MSSARCLSEHGHRQQDQFLEEKLKGSRKVGPRSSALFQSVTDCGRMRPSAPRPRVDTVGTEANDFQVKSLKDTVARSGGEVVTGSRDKSPVPRQCPGGGL